jgi:elongation factor G
VIKTFYTPQGGKLSLVRVWQGELKDGDSLNGSIAPRIAWVASTIWGNSKPAFSPLSVRIVAIARLDQRPNRRHPHQPWRPRDSIAELPRAPVIDPVYALAITPEKRSDEVKLSGALTKLIEEDPSLAWEQHGDTHEIILWGQGDVHLKLAIARLKRKYNLPMTTHVPLVQYKETIRQAKEEVHGRYKHQSGGHGQFGDVYLSIKPLGRGRGLHL